MNDCPYDDGSPEGDMWQTGFGDGTNGAWQERLWEQLSPALAVAYSTGWNAGKTAMKSG